MHELSEKQLKSMRRAKENCERILRDQLGMEVDVKITLRMK